MRRRAMQDARPSRFPYKAGKAPQFRIRVEPVLIWAATGRARDRHFRRPLQGMYLRRFRLNGGIETLKKEEYSRIGLCQV